MRGTESPEIQRYRQTDARKQYRDTDRIQSQTYFFFGKLVFSTFHAISRRKAFWPTRYRHRYRQRYCFHTTLVGKQGRRGTGRWGNAGPSGETVSGETRRTVGKRRRNAAVTGRDGAATDGNACDLFVPSAPRRLSGLRGRRAAADLAKIACKTSKIHTFSEHHQRIDAIVSCQASQS